MVVKVEGAPRAKALPPRWADRWLKRLKALGVDVEVIWCSSSQMKSLKARLLGVNQSTDVLSWGVIPDRSDQPVRLMHLRSGLPPVWKQVECLGTMWINQDWLKRVQSPGERIRIAEAWLTHGLTHLLGFDHERNGKNFARVQKKLGTLLGVGVIDEEEWMQIYTRLKRGSIKSGKS